MLVSRHRIGEYLTEVVHQGPDPAAVAVCREVLAGSGAGCVILHGSRWGGWDKHSDLNVILVQWAAADRAGCHSPPGTLGLVKERHYPGYRDDRVHGVLLDSGQECVPPEFYAAHRRTLNHPMARAARNGTIFPSEPGTEDRYRHDSDTSNEWELITRERLRMAAS